ncbi:MAG: phosphate transporter substrate-binding protein PstS [Frankiales bacterium]|nr:phosphate transporter substrate-binding protein PstS [Frankiales bacterium]
MDLQRSGRLLAVVAAGTIVLSACGSDGPSDTAAPGTSAPATVSGTIAGAGSSAQSAAMKAWQAGFAAANKGATVNYDPVGSGGGREQFLAGGIQFAGSDSALKDEEIAKSTTACPAGIIEVPAYISPIAVVYNLKGVDSLNLSPATIAKIFNQKITTWDDAAIKADNPDAKLPSTKITPVNRADSSGTTQNFTDYLAKAAAADWAYPAAGDFPVKGGEAAQGTSGVIQAVTEADGGIGYADESQAKDLKIAKIKVGSEFVAPSAAAASAVVAASPVADGRKPGDLALKLNRTGTTGYPVVLVTYSIACSSYSDASKGALVKAFLTYVASDAGQKAAAGAAGSSPLSGELATKVRATIDGIKVGA